MMKKFVWILLILVSLAIYILGYVAVVDTFDKPIADIRNYAVNFDTQQKKLIEKRNDLITLRERKYSIYKSLLDEVYQAEVDLKIQELSKQKQSEIQAQLELARQQQLQQQLLAQQLAAQQQAQTVQQVAKPVTRVVRRRVRKTRAS